MILILVIVLACFLVFVCKNQTDPFTERIQNPKVLIISCNGHGNIGDNMYSEVFTKFLPECEIIKISDHSLFVDIDRNLGRKVPKIGYPFDFLIIGGGGLIIASKLAKDSLNMPHYIEEAKQRQKPLFIISCGVQGSIENFQNDFSSWKDALNYAKLITVRSKKDKELLDTITDPAKVHYFRDLGYMFPHIIRPHKNLTKTVTLIIAGPVHAENDTIRKYIKKAKKDVVIMNMGAIKDDNNNRRMLEMDFPEVNVRKYYGSGKAQELIQIYMMPVEQNEMENILRLNPTLEQINPSDLTLEKVVNIIYNSDMVFTGRYHGFVFARSLGVKYDTLGMGTNKVLWEEPATEIKDMVQNSYNHIKMLRKVMTLPDTCQFDLFSLNVSVDFTQLK